jgi:hypothetical protein
MEDELEELKLNEQEGEEKLNEMMDRKVRKMRKKYETKISVLKADIKDAAEVMKCFFLLNNISIHVLNFHLSKDNSEDLLSTN